MTRLAIELGAEAFRFHSKEHWMAKARDWYWSLGLHAGQNAIAIDAAGRICTCGAHFARAEADGTYPIVVYHVDPELEGSTSERRGNWIQMYPSGQRFWPLDPRSDEVFFGDIAHHLSHQCRFGGGVAVFYSVAQHSCHVADKVFELLGRDGAETPTVRQIALTALMHDAAEAYLVDLPRPVKHSLAPYLAWEARIMSVIAPRFGLLQPQPPCVKEADDRMLATERRELLVPSPVEWGPAQGGLGEPYPERIKPWGPARARTEFAKRFMQWSSS